MAGRSKGLRIKEKKKYFKGIKERYKEKKDITWRKKKKEGGRTIQKNTGQTNRDTKKREGANQKFSKTGRGGRRRNR